MPVVTLQRQGGPERFRGFQADGPAAKVTCLKGKLAKLTKEMARLNAINAELQASPDKQIPLTAQMDAG